MLVQLIFDKFEQAQQVYDLCAISNLDTYDFISPEDDDWFGNLLYLEYKLTY